MTDRERQENEIAALSEIYDREEFSWTKKDGSDARVEFCRLNGIITLPKKSLKITCLSDNLMPKHHPSSPERTLFVRHLPPVTLHVKIPPNYPSVDPPSFQLAVSWLPCYKMYMVCRKLDKLWMKNKGNEILLVWFNFLKFDLLEFLDIQNCLDVTSLYNAFRKPHDYIQSALIYQTDPRAVNDKLFKNPKIYLMEYDTYRHEIHFRKSSHHCSICLDTFLEANCMEVKQCGHAYCRICFKEYIVSKIGEGFVKSIPCPNDKCKSQITPDQVKELVSPELYEKYECLLL